MRLARLTALPLLLLAAGCGGGAPSGRGLGVPSVPPPPPSTVQATSTPSSAALADLHGLGEGHDAFISEHRPDPAYADTYDPTPGLGEDPAHSDVFFGGMFGDGADGPLYAYSQRLPHGLSLVRAERAVAAYLPRDKVDTWRKQFKDCTVVHSHSQKLAARGMNGDLEVEYQSEPGPTASGYSARNVDLAVVTTVGTSASPSDVTAC